jgi:predicted RND superfamily exporter protein
MLSFFEALERRRVPVLGGTLVLTALLVIPLLTMQPDGNASQNPDAAVFDTQDVVDERFRSSIYTPTFIVEARDGDILRRDPLFELLQNQRALRASEVGDVLVEHYDPDTNRVSPGLFTLADAVDGVLLANWVGGLEFATDDQVKIAVSLLLEEGKASAGFRDTLSDDRRSERRVVGTQNVEIDYWSASALIVQLYADNDALGGGSTTVEVGSDDTTLEEYARDAQSLLRGGEEHSEVWGIAIDVNLTSEEEGATAGPFIGLTIITVLLVVGLLLRSYWAVATIGAGLAILVVWLKGISNLVGLDSSLTLDLIVPIAMVSFGVDFSFHALGRYREERGRGGVVTPPRAFAAGLAGVIGALSLALISDSIAFLANVTAGIPSVIQFGIGATIALTAAFVVLGVLVPLLVSALDALDLRHPGAVRGRGVRVAGIVGASTFAGAAVLTLIAAPAVGVGVVALYVLIFLVVPIALVRRSSTAGTAVAPSEAGVVIELRGAGAAPGLVAGIVGGLCRLRLVFLPAVFALTAIAAVFAVRVEAAFDVQDFFSSETDFVVGLNKLDQHVGDRGGEEAIFYVEADLSNPGVLAVIDAEFAELDATGSERFARDEDGNLVVSVTPSDLSSAVLASSVATAEIEGAANVSLSDVDGDAIADTPQQLVAIFGGASASGIALDEARLRYTADQVRQVVWRDGDGKPAAARISIQLPGTRAVENIEAAQEELEPFLERFNAALRSVDPDARVALTGGPFTRQESLDATYRALQLSLPIAVVLCLVVAAFVMRSLRYALASIIPILLVVVWLYAFMYVAGFTLNLVTATIGAISIGVGIDYAIHYTMRFREELASGDRVVAVQRAGASTGTALLGSALSSVVGFTVLSFAPMPLFASYGLLTAVMIVLAAAAALIVLPPLLVLLTPEPATQPAGERSR